MSAAPRHQLPSPLSPPAHAPRVNSPRKQVYSHSTSLSSGWSAWETFADKGSNTYASQTTFILPYGNGNIMYMGDRWVSRNLQASTYVWLPLTVDGTKVTLKNRGSWIPNAADPAGTWEAAPAQTTYDATAGVYEGSARDVPCARCEGGKAAGYLGGGEGNDGRLTLSGIRSDGADGALTTVQLRYTNGDSSPRYAALRVNGAAEPVEVAFQPSAGEVRTSVVHVPLQSGEANELVFEGLRGGWAPDLEKVIVPVE